MTRVVPILDRTAERKARIVGDATAHAEPPVCLRDGCDDTRVCGAMQRCHYREHDATPANDERRPKPSFTALESLSAYWRGRASGRQAAVDFYRGIACDRAVTVGVDVSHDMLRDHQAVAEYERRADMVMVK